MMETGWYATIKEIAKAEKINPSYVSRVLRLTLLAVRQESWRDPAGGSPAQVNE
jgi:hypothetical protein